MMLAYFYTKLLRSYVYSPDFLSSSVTLDQFSNVIVDIQHFNPIIVAADNLTHFIQDIIELKVSATCRQLFCTSINYISFRLF